MNQPRSLTAWLTPALAVAVAGLFVAAVFVAKGGLLLAGNTYVEEIAVAVSAGVIVAAVVLHRGQPLYGSFAFAAVGALTVYTGLSIGWSLIPSESWLEFNRTVAYLMVFVLGMAAVRVWTKQWTAPIYAILLTVGVVVVTALITKVLPGVFSQDETFARLREPFGYWNAVALTCAFGFPLSLWLGTRSLGDLRLNTLAYPLFGLSIVTLFLSFSRGGLLAGALGLIVWFAVVPLRLRSLSVLLPSAVGGGLVVLWAFGQNALTQDNVVLSQREHAGLVLLVLVVALAVVLYAAGYWINSKSAETSLPEGTRHKLGTVAIACVIAAPLIGVGALALSSEGLSGKVSNTWHSLTSEGAPPPSNSPNRFTSAASVRARYWREAIKIFDDHYWKGSGAGAYATVRDRYRTSNIVVRQAHGQIVQALADLGLIGALLTVLAGIAWLLAALRTTEMLPRFRGSPWTDERAGMFALGLVPVLFGLHTAIDWTWYVPGVALPALFAAGWIAARGPLRDPEGPTVELPQAGGGVLAFFGGWKRLVIAAYALVFALVAMWSIWQPLRADRLGSDAVLLSANGDTFKAINEARDATKINPLSVDALFALSAVDTKADQRDAGLAALQKAVQLQPANPETWLQLGDYELDTLKQPMRAVQLFGNAIFLDPQGREPQRGFLRANRMIEVQRVNAELNRKILRLRRKAAAAQRQTAPAAPAAATPQRP